MLIRSGSSSNLNNQQVIEKTDELLTYPGKYVQKEKQNSKISIDGANVIWYWSTHPTEENVQKRNDAEKTFHT